MMNEHDLWKMFAKTGDIELYNMYRAMKEYEEKEKDTVPHGSVDRN